MERVQGNNKQTQGVVGHNLEKEKLPKTWRTERGS